MKIFEGLNSEKATPSFLKLTKKSNVGKLANINNNGVPFANTTERENFIVSEYEKIFVIPDSEPEDYSTVIRDFLGDEIAESDLVRGSKLTEDESNSLESRITVEELDLALKKCNMKSAPGLDGISNQIISKCWKFLRIP